MASEVREIATALSSLTSEDLRRRYDSAGLKASWPLTPYREDEDDEHIFGALERDFGRLTTCYRIAAARENAMLIAVI